MLFVFDMDNVLYDYHWRVRMDGLSALTGHGFHELRRRWWHDEGEWLAEKGVPPTGEEYLAAVNLALESDISQTVWLEQRRAAMTARPDVIAVAQKASALGEVAVLTNNGALIGEHLADIAPELVPVFGRRLYATSSFRARKPEPEVFLSALEFLGHSPDDTFFVDDMPENVRGAQSIGITAHWFGPHTAALQLWDWVEQFARERGSLGGPVSESGPGESVPTQ